MTGPTRRTKLVRSCADAAQRVTTRLMRTNDAEWLELDLTMGQFKAMMVLADMGPQPVGRLARTLGIAEPSASALADKLAARGFAARRPDVADRRRILVEPSAACLELVDRLRHVREEGLLEALDRLNDTDLAALAQGLGALAGIVDDRAPAPPAPDLRLVRP